MTKKVQDSALVLHSAKEVAYINWASVFYFHFKPYYQSCKSLGKKQPGSAHFSKELFKLLSLGRTSLKPLAFAFTQVSSLGSTSPVSLCQVLQQAFLNEQFKT